MVTTQEIKKVILDLLSCDKTKISKKNKKALLSLLRDLDENNSKKSKKKITECEWYKILIDIITTLAQIASSITNYIYESG